MATKKWIFGQILYFYTANLAIYWKGFIIWRQTKMCKQQNSFAHINKAEKQSKQVFHDNKFIWKCLQMSFKIRMFCDITLIVMKTGY